MLRNDVVCLDFILLLDWRVAAPLEEVGEGAAKRDFDDDVAWFLLYYLLLLLL